MAGRRKVPFSEALASPQSLGPWNTKGVQRELYCMALVLASRGEYFWKSEQFHFILAINVLFRDLDLNLAAPGEILIYLLAAYVACRETKLEGCAPKQHGLQTWPIHFVFGDTASPPRRLEQRFRPVQAKGFGAAGHPACVANSPATSRNGGSGAQCGDCKKDTRSWPCF